MENALYDGGASPSLYVDAKATVYDMAPAASFVDSPTGRVKAAVIPRNTDTKSLAAMLKTAKDDGAEIALITEEDYFYLKNGRQRRAYRDFAGGLNSLATPTPQPPPPQPPQQAGPAPNTTCRPFQRASGQTVSLVLLVPRATLP